MSPHDLEDTYLPAFRASYGGNAHSVMCAYNAIERSRLRQRLVLQDHLRKAWRFDG